MSDDRPNVYTENGITVYRASALGSCIRSLVLARRGIDPQPHPDWLLEAFAQGHAHEEEILRRFEVDQDYTLDGAQQEVELRVTPTVIVRGHLDGRTRMATGLCVVDAKAVQEVTYQKIEKGWPVYDWQTSAYCAAIEADQYCLACGIKDPDDGWTLTDVTRYVWGKPKYTRRDIVLRVLEIERLAKGDDLPACPVPPDYPCPYYQFHDEAEEPEFVELTGQAANDLLHAHDLWRTMKKREDEAKAAKELYLKAARKLATDHGNKVQAGTVRMTWVEDREVPETTRTVKAHTQSGHARFKEMKK